MVPATLVTVFGVAAVIYLLDVAKTPAAGQTRLVLIAALAACVLVVILTSLRVSRLSRRLAQRVGDLQTSTMIRRDDVQGVLEQLKHGERPSSSDVPIVDSNDMFTELEHDLNRAFLTAQAAVLEASALRPVSTPDQQAEVFVNLARRLQSLVHRAIQMMDDLENQVEDPDMLKGLFQVDHLVTRIRRHAENLAVLGGGGSQRRWSTPVALTEVLRSAVAEVEEYKRVKLVPPIEGSLQGHAVADVVHLVAELVENATTFSPPHTQVMLRAQTVSAGVAIEVEDRGLGIPRADQYRVNSFLTDPNQIDRTDLLRDGRLGLYVVSTLARRHGITAQLQSNIYGGIQAVAILPPGLVSMPSQLREVPAPREQRETREPQPVRRRPAPTMPAQPRVAVTAPASNRPLLPDMGPPSMFASHDDSLMGRPSIGGPPPMSPPSPSPSPSPAPLAPSAGDGPIYRSSGQDVRPMLPHRNRQTHMAPQLQQPPSRHREDEVVDHDPTLMAQFMGGFRSAEINGDDGYGQPPSATIG